MKQFILSCVLSVAAIAPSQAQQTTRQLPVYLDQTKPVEQRIDDAISRMTLAEKIRIIHAQSKFSSAGVPRLGFPDFWTDDGPHGVRPDVLWDEWEQAGQTNDSCVAFPALTCLAASWNPQMSRIYGEALGEEALVLLYHCKYWFVLCYFCRVCSILRICSCGYQSHQGCNNHSFLHEFFSLYINVLFISSLEYLFLRTDFLFRNISFWK